MKKFWVMWTYLGNYAEKLWQVEAESAEAAARKVSLGFSEDFQKKGTVYVFTAPPACVLRRGTVE